MNSIANTTKTIRVSSLITTISLSVILVIAVFSAITTKTTTSLFTLMSIPVHGQNQGEQSLNKQSPDDDCLFNPSLAKCAPTDGNNCPEGFLMNADAQCYPNKSCPSGFERRDGDETGACYPTNSTTSA